MSVLGEGDWELAVYHRQENHHTKAGTGGSGPWTCPHPKDKQNLGDADTEWHRVSISVTQLLPLLYIHYMALKKAGCKTYHPCPALTSLALTSIPGWSLCLHTGQAHGTEASVLLAIASNQQGSWWVNMAVPRAAVAVFP